MNKSKVTFLVIAVVVAAAVGIVIYLSGVGNTKEIKLATNQFTAKIEQEIEQLKAQPDNKFCKDFYKEVAFHINDFYKQNRFGQNQSENDQWKENMEKILYSAYVEKFISQAFYVFRNSVWKTEDLQFIRSEYATLQKSALLEKNSPVDKKLTEIKQIFAKYDEIAGFISACKGFSYSSFDLSARFPIADTQTKISRARQYLNNGLDNAYVKNCTRLQEGLKEAPQALFRAHIRYLDRKIDKWSNMYSNYNSQSDYANNLFQPLKRELDLLDNNTYRASNFSGEYSRLLGKLNADSQRAYNYFSSRP